MNHTMRSDDIRDHDGMKVKRIREMLKVKQSTLAHTLGEDWTQKKISQLEDKEVIDDKLMGEIAAALKVPVEAIRNFDEEKTVTIITNTYNDSATSNDQSASSFSNSVINPMEKWMEVMEENKRLYERLLQSEKEKVAMLQRMLEKK